MKSNNKVNNKYLGFLTILATVAAYAPGHEEELTLNFNRSGSDVSEANISERSEWIVADTPQAADPPEQPVPRSESNVSEASSEWILTDVPQAAQQEPEPNQGQEACSLAIVISSIGDTLGGLVSRIC